MEGQGELKLSRNKTISLVSGNFAFFKRPDLYFCRFCSHPVLALHSLGNTNINFWKSKWESTPEQDTGEDFPLDIGDSHYHFRYSAVIGERVF